MLGLVIGTKKIREPKVYTLEEYLRREERSVEKHEFYNGKIIKMPGGTDRHSEIGGNVITALKLAVRLLPHKFRVYTSDLKIYIEPMNFGVYPDALVVCETPQYWNGRTDLIVNPLLIVEVLSRSTQVYDRFGKFDLYKMLPSFKEYVLIDSKKTSVETRFREEEDLWRIKTETNMSNTVSLRSLGVAIKMEDIYENINFTAK